MDFIDEVHVLHLPLGGRQRLAEALLLPEDAPLIVEETEVHGHLLQRLIHNEPVFPELLPLLPAGVLRRSHGGGRALAAYLFVTFLLGLVFRVDDDAPRLRDDREVARHDQFLVGQVGHLLIAHDGNFFFRDEHGGILEEEVVEFLAVGVVVQGQRRHGAQCAPVKPLAGEDGVHEVGLVGRVGLADVCVYPVEHRRAADALQLVACASGVEQAVGVVVRQLVEHALPLTAGIAADALRL